jgi:hypothetical protein
LLINSITIRRKIPKGGNMIKTTGPRYLSVSITLVFILLVTLIIGIIGASCQESKTLKSGKITLIADDNNTFSDLSRNMSMQAVS